MFTAESIDRVREVDIIQVVSHFIALGRHNSACCPFHNEKSASFSVHPGKQIYKCFGCGAGGDAISFVCAYNHCDFLQAVETIADIAGIPLEMEHNTDSDTWKRRREERNQLREILKDAHAAYISHLHGKSGSPAIDYLTYRGYDIETIISWGFGFAPFNKEFLAKQYVLDGRIDDAIKMGLCMRKEDKASRDVYINRVIIPILDENGELVSLAGRIMEPGNKYPKYINGYATALYDKSKTLFGLYQAIPHIKKQGFAILTEGYTDVISMHMAGATNTVAACGTSFTADMARLLKRYTNTVLLMGDADPAGEKAQEKNLDILLQHNFKVDVLPLDIGQDPDDFAKSFFAVAELSTPAA